jgi:glutamate dehydrogenase (NAD(P)+)
MWSEDQVNQKLKELMLRSFGNVRKLSKDGKMTMRTAALTLGVQKIAREKLHRGLFP